MPDGQRNFPVLAPILGAYGAWPAHKFAIPAKTLYPNRFRMPVLNRTCPRSRLGGRGFQRIKEGLRETGVFDRRTFGASHKKP
jgi:hypothetical protein